jgi:hypothetical protein
VRAEAGSHGLVECSHRLTSKRRDGCWCGTAPNAQRRDVGEPAVRPVLRRPLLDPGHALARGPPGVRMPDHTGWMADPFVVVAHTRADDALDGETRELPGRSRGQSPLRRQLSAGCTHRVAHQRAEQAASNSGQLCGRHRDHATDDIVPSTAPVRSAWRTQHRSRPGPRWRLAGAEASDHGGLLAYTDKPSAADVRAWSGPHGRAGSVP